MYTVSETPRPLGDLSALPPFCQEAWIDIYQKHFKGELRFFHLLKNNTLQALLPLHIRKMGPLTKAFTPFSQPLAGPFFYHPEESPRRWSEKQRHWRVKCLALTEYLQTRYSSVQLGPDAYAYETFSNQNWQALPQPHYFYNPEAEPDFELRTVATIKKAIKAGFKVEECSTLPEFGQWYEQLYKQNNIPLTLSPQILAAYQSDLIQAGLIQAIKVVDQNNLNQAFLSYFSWEGGKMLFPWHSCQSPESKTGSTLTFHHLALLGQQKQMRVNFGGGIDPSLLLFKEQFSNSIENFYTLKKFRSLPEKIVLNTATTLHKMFA